MESLDEMKAHERMEGENKEKWVLGRWSREMIFWENIIESEEGTFFRWSH
jgi:hypothetical protein